MGYLTQKKKHVSPTTKAVARLTSSKAVIRQATLAWLEQAGAHREPEYLTLTSHTELLDIVKTLREAPSVDFQVRPPPPPAFVVSSLCACRVYWYLREFSRVERGGTVPLASTSRQ